MVGLMSVWKLIFLILWSIGFLIFTSCVKAPTYEFDLQLYQVDESLLECPTGWLKFRNQCYYIVNEEATFQQADILCKRYGGHLVKTDGYNSNQGFGKLISNHNISHVWIGLQRKKSGEFWWSNGQLAEAADGFWTTQLPIQSTEYDLCTVMTTTLSDYGEYRWTLNNCDIGYSSVCQTSACVAGQFRCSDGSGCISRSWICDGIHQCSDRSDELMCPGSCGGHLQGILQTFHSPHYPQTYPKHSSCIWRLETPVGTRVYLKFESFTVETLYDKVIIHDGSSEKDPLVGTYSGTDKPSVPYSSSNFYLVIFQSDQDNQMSGFNASFSAVPMDKCGSEMIASSKSQWFGSPNFPNSYPNNILCDWIIKTSNSVDLISLQFHRFSIDTSDFIEIRQGESIDSPLYGRFTGDDIPPVFISTSHSFFIRLYTDFTHTGTGFNATYKTGCNNTILQGYARIMSPGYGITKYPNSINCDWTISDPLQRNLTLVFNNNFDTEKGFDNVTVYTNNHTSYTHAGQGAPPAITTQSEQFHVNFSSDSQVNRNGWAITVSFDCPSLNLSDHLQMNSSITTFGTYVLFYCDNGYQLAGTSVLICDIGGRWSTSPPSCKVINCGSPSIPVNTKLVSVSSTFYLGRAVYKCNSGYKMSTNDTSICQSNRQWTLPYCAEISCPKLDMTEKLMLKYTSAESHYVYGDIVIYDCDSNYRLIGASMVYCTENGTWSKPTPSCKPPVCPPIYIRNGYTNATNIVMGGDYIQVSCNNGYSLTGNPIVFCDLNGVYTALPYCSDINECVTGNVCGGHSCQNTPGSYRCVCNHGYQNPPNSYTVCKDTDECSTFPCTGICENLSGKYRCNCNPPQELYTENIIRIVKRKVLRPNSTCIAVCSSFSVSNGGVIVADTVPLSSGSYIAPTTVMIHCPRGTVPDGSVVVECQLDGTWNNTVTTCRNQECEQLSLPLYGRIFYLNATRGYNSVVQYSCKEGYELSGVEYRFCQPINDTTQFDWTGIEPVCKEIKCQALPDPANGQAVYGSTTVGSVLQYSCNCGYHLIGSKVRICQPGGLWDGKNAICAPSTVCQSPVSSGSVVMSNISPFYTVGTEVNFQCKNPGYQIADTTPIKCVIERPTENIKPKYNLIFEMRFLTPSNFNKSCDYHYVNETVELFKELVEQSCKDPYRPLTTIKTVVNSGDVLQIDLTIQLSEPRKGSFDLVCNCSTALQEIVSTGLIQNNINNVTFNGSEDTTCPTVRLRTADSDNITSTSNWSCDEGYELVHQSEICVNNLDLTCVKSTATAPNYVIEMTAVLIPANLSQPCKDNINTAISDILSSTEGVSNSLQNSKTCSKYNIKVFIETSINMTLSAVKVTKKYSLVGQSQSILTPCGQDIDDKLLLELRESLSNLPSQTVCLQSLQDSSITVSQWKCSDGYTMDESGEICHIFTLTTDSVTIETTSAVPTTKVTTVVITEPPTTTSSTTTTPTTTTLKPTTRGTTLPPTDPAFYLIQVEAIFTGSNLTWKGCIDATRTQIEEKVESISLSIIQGLKKTWKQCTKQSDIVLLSQTGKIAVTPERLELTAPFAIQSPNVATDIVTDCARNAVEGHIQDKFQGLLREINPGVCFVTLQTFQIPFSSWACNNSYEYDSTSEICRLIQTTTPPPSNALLMAYDIKYFIPHGRLSLSIQFLHLSIQNQVFCLTEYRNRLVSLMQSQTSLFNNGNMVDAKKYCADIYISLYGIDSKGEDVVLSVSPGMLNGQVAVKLFATSSSFTSNGSYNSCIAWIASKLMNVSSHALIGQSTLPSSNVTLCSNVTLDNVSITNRAFNCTTGYQMALYNAYFLCLRDDRTKYIAPFLLSYQWHQPSSNSCIQSLMTRLSAESIPFVQQYAKQPSCASDIILQQNGSITATFISNYLRGNITIAYELSSQTETAGSISTFSSCANTIIQEAKTYFEQKSVEILSSEKVMESCGSTQPVVTMPLISGYYICPSEKTWDQISNQCINAENDTAIIKGTLTSVSSFSVLQTQQFETTSDQSVTSHNIKQNELESTKTTQDQQTFTRNSINSTAKQINEEKISSAQTAPLGTTPNNLEVVTKGKTADTTPNFVDVTFIINTIHSIRIITVDYIPTILSTTKTSITTPATKSTSVTTPTTTETYVTTPATTKTSVTSPATKSTSVTTPATTETSVTTPATKSTIVTTPKTTETSVTTPTTTETYVTTPAITKTSVTSPATKSTSVTTPASTETSVTTPATKCTSVTTPATTETSVTTPATKSTSVTTPTTTETSVTTPATQSTSVTTPATTETSETTPATTETSVTSPTTKSISVTTPATTETSVLTPTQILTTETRPITTKTSVLTPVKITTTVRTPTTTETSVLTTTPISTTKTTPTTTETLVTSKTTAETFITSQTTAETFEPTTTDTSVTTPTSTETFVIKPTTPTTLETSVPKTTTTETSVTTPTTTEISVTTPTTTESFVTTPTTQNTFVPIPTTTEKPVPVPTTTDKSVTTPTETETSVTTPTTTETSVTTPTTTETSVATPTTTETSVTTPNTPETSVTTPTTIKKSVTTPTKTEKSVTTPTTTETSVTTPTTTETSVTTPTTTETTITTPTTTETSVTSVQTPITTKTYVTTPTSAETYVTTPSSTKTYMTTSTTLETSEASVATPTKYETTVPTPTITETVVTTPTTTETYVTIPTMTETFVTTPTTTETSVTTLTTNKTSVTTPVTSEPLVSTTLTAKTSVTTAATTYQSGTTSLTKNSETPSKTYSFEPLPVTTIPMVTSALTTKIFVSTVTPETSVSKSPPSNKMTKDKYITSKVASVSTPASTEISVKLTFTTNKIPETTFSTQPTTETSVTLPFTAKTSATIGHNKATTTEHVDTSTIAYGDATTTEHVDTSTIAYGDATTTEHVYTSTIAYGDATTTEHVFTSTMAHDDATTTEHIDTSTIAHDDATTTEHVDTSTIAHDDATTTERVDTSTIAHDDATTTEHVYTSTMAHDDATTTEHIDTSTIAHDDATTTEHVDTSTIAHNDATTTEHFGTLTIAQDEATTKKQLGTSTIRQDDARTTQQIDNSTTRQDDAATIKQIYTSTVGQDDATTTKQIGTSVIIQDDATTKQIDNSTIGQDGTTTTKQIGTSTIRQDDATTTKHIDTSTTGQYDATTTKQIDNSTIGQDGATTTIQIGTSIIGQDDATTTKQIGTSTTRQGDATTTKQIGTSIIGQDNATTTKQLGSSIITHLDATTKEQIGTSTIKQDDAINTEQLNTSALDEQTTTEQVDTYTIAQDNATTTEQFVTSLVGQDNAITTGQVVTSTISQNDAITTKKHGTSTIKQDDAINTEQLNTSALDEQTTTEQVDTYTIAQDNATTTEQFVTSLVGQDNAITTGQVVTSTISQNDAITKKDGTSTTGQDDPITTEQIEITTAKTDIINTEHGGTVTIEHTQINTTASQVNSSSTSDIPYTSTELGDTFRTADKQTTEYTNQSQANTIESTSQPTSIHTPVSSITQTQSITTLQTSTPLKITTALLSTQITTEQTDPPLCYECNRKKNDESCNQITKQCQQGESCQTLVVYYTKKAIITKKCANLCEASLNACDPTDYQTTCIYCCSDNLCNEETSFLNWQDGRKKRKKRSALLTEMNREKRSVEVLTTTTAFWNSSVPNCLDVEPPVFQNCPTKDIIVHKELWGPVFVNISQPTAVDNSGISPKITVTPEDLRQPYLFRENTTVTFTAEDGSGNSEQCEIHVILIDIHPLTIRCPVDVVYVPYATNSDMVNITYNSVNVVASSSATHITYQPAISTSIRIKEHVEVKATAHDSNGNTASCNFTYEATRDDQIPLYKIKVVYSVTNVHSNPDDCPKKYGKELFNKIQNLSVTECNDSFMLLPSITVHQDKLVVDISVMFMNFKTLDFDSMKYCGNLSAQKMIDAGNLTLAPSGCEQLELIFIDEETTQNYLCESNFTVLNRTSKYCTYCNKGTFSNQTSGQCEVCPVTQDSIPTECMACSQDSSVCLDLCKPGEYSPTGLQPCTKCSVGTYTDTYNSTICQSCTPGNSTLSTGTNSLHGCIDECPKGSYSQTGLVPCQPCPQLFYSDKTRSQSCTECPPGQVTPSIGSSSVNQCNDPKVCSDGICNHGSCVTKDNGRHFVCDCLPGFAGAVCDVDIQECDSNPCFNGECVDEENNYSCLCYQGYTGHDCETSINDCSLNTCSNGTCIDGVNSSTCLCYDGFTGDSSCVEKTECDPNPCEHGGLCIDLIDDFICNCSGTGYVGKNCSMLPERCYNGSCLNDGVCHPHVNGYSCSCAQGYTGEYCQINIDECQGHYCRNQAVCIDGVNSYTCLCQPGYNGSYCDYNIMCDTNPCVNGASCQTTLTAFMCDCLPGYSGVLCEVNIDECKQNNCNPDTSQCVDQINGYTCNCLPGWTGEYCDEPTKECLSSPCAHRSQCFDHENQFSCSCVDGYTGHNCSTQVIECDSHPCYNDGQCLDQVNGYKCTCKGSFTGSQCEKHVDLCVGSPCLHNGTCQNLVDTFICKCEVGWTGSRCESLIDNCVSLPCYNNAVCINNINQYTCVCKPGYTGSHCQKDIDECVTDPCLHAGVCTNLIGGYYCTCPDGYTGTDCADLDIPCPSCQNGANKCFNGECVCLPGYIGPDCGKEVNSDYDLYFHGNSRIETGVKRIKNRNQFSLCLWLKTFGLVSSMPVLTLVADNGNSEHEVLSIYNDSIHLSYFSQTEFNLSMTPWSWNHLCVTWDSHMRGHWSVYINGQIQMEGIEFGNGQELPQRQRIVLGQVTADYNSTFHGMISQVNLYDSVLNESEITTGGNNCSISMPTGTVFRWQEFASYVNSETAGVDVIEPSLCGSEACPLGYEGEWCNATEDTEAPTVIYCPEHIQVVTANRLNIVNWTEPQFTDNVGIINIVQTHRSGQVFAYGEYDIMYIAYDTENNTAICSFTVYVIPFNCSLPPPPSNVILTCSSWSEGLQCSVKCQDPRIQSFVEEVPPFYKCGREGFWDPPRGEEFNFPICAEASSPDGTIKGELVYLGPPCTLSSKQILNESFVKNMNNWNMEFGLCPEIGCNFSNITILCMSSGKRRRRSTKSTYNVTFDIPVNGSLMSDGVNALPLTQLETMIKNEEFNTDDFSCDAEKLVVKPYIKCQTGQILVDTYCVNCVRGTYYDNTNELCGVCPRGQYTDQGRQTACKSCDVGYTTESSGTTSSTLCYKSCNIGNYYDKTLSNCKPCERGYYQDETGKTTCKSCGNGKTTENTGSTSVTNCQNSCKAGTELSVSGTCELCAQGTYKSEDSQDTCQPCPYGYSTHKKGATSVQQCSVVSCPPDYKYDSSTQKCIVCPPGYHQPYQGQSSCIPCTYSKFDINIKKCLSGEIDECAIHQDNCDDNADCRDTKDSFECQCKFGFKGNGTTCIDKCIGACDVKVACIIDNSGEPQCKQDTSGPFPLIAVAGGASSFVLIIILIIITFVCRRRSNQKKRKETPHNYQHMDRVHRELEVVTYPRGLPRTVQFRTNPAYSDSELSDPTVYHGGPSSAPLWARPVFPDHEDISKYSETSLKRPLRLRITQEMKNDQQYEIESNKSWHDSSPGSSLSQYRDDTHHSSPNSSISKYRVDSNPKDSSPSSSISHYKEDSLHKNDSPISNKSDFSDSFF
ncbi:uncharacterized protein LOC127709241 isoform X4 [Mytilus californianus]|uniref:uncharacterized protein LOC127709241 isoform X4 n=1 Tax=Mytilus californianus TaxID=6549 RepID=UPI0022474D32|nr:uncharacterized protein LOC127709241 isoform X4 [Mytilus californianus]